MFLKEFHRMKNSQVIDLVASEVLYKLDMGRKPSDTLSSRLYRVHDECVFDEHSELVGYISD